MDTIRYDTIRYDYDTIQYSNSIQYKTIQYGYGYGYGYAGFEIYRYNKKVVLRIGVRTGTKVLEQFILDIHWFNVWISIHLV